MHRIKYFALLLVFILSACGSGRPVRHEGLMIKDSGNGGEIAFTIMQHEDLFDDYGISHTKKMHVIAVRDDLRHFEHLHPEQDAEGVWRVSYNPPAGGKYWVFASFVDSTGMNYTLRFERTYNGEIGEYGLVYSPERAVRIGRYMVTMEPRISNVTAAYRFRVTELSGEEVALEEYLGAMGHMVLISSSGEFIHTHPIEEGNTPIFMTDTPKGDWRIFAQFQINGEVITAPFDWSSQIETPSSAGMEAQDHMNH